MSTSEEIGYWLQATKSYSEPDESSLYPSVCRLLVEKGYLTYQRFPHGKYNPFEIDVLGFRGQPFELFMVEVKLRHINKAVRQGIARLPYADYVSLAFPESYACWVYGKFRYALQDKGLGLISINGFAKEIISPRRSRHQKAIFKECILRDLDNKFSQGLEPSLIQKSCSSEPYTPS